MQQKFTIITLLLLATFGLKGEKLDTLGTPITVEIDVTICPGSIFTDPSGTFTEAGTYIDTFAIVACDSIRILNLNFFEEAPDIIMEYCMDDLLFPSDPGTTLEQIEDENGCDQNVFHVILPETPDVITEVEICPGDTVTWMDQSMTEL